MRRIVILLFSVLASAPTFSQTVTSIIDEGIYKSYFCSAIKEPLYVVYHLYKGGGDCSRKNMRFTVRDYDSTATSRDYARTGYDKGHLANAEDFAANRTNESKTFRYFNCVPQTHALNAGIWKHYETEIRKLSLTHHLLIICGGIYGTKKIGRGVFVPTHCWKIVYDADHNDKLLYCLLFPNDKSDKVMEVSLSYLENMLGYNLLF
jgi:endonuclease G